MNPMSLEGTDIIPCPCCALDIGETGHSIKLLRSNLLTYSAVAKYQHDIAYQIVFDSAIIPFHSSVN